MKNSTKKSGEKTFGFNEVMSLLESMNDGIKVISEQYGGVVARLDKIDDRLDRMETRMDGVETRLDNGEVELGRLRDCMVEVKYGPKNKVDRDELKSLEDRVVKVGRLSYSH